tara:strand:- start:317 stop:1768 length:1452 start_codon:yes stop_codon:yes gene_type:complete
MDVPSSYLINDTRKPELFKKTTFSNYLKKEVFQTVFKKIDSGHASEVCLWSTECIISGYLDELWDKSLEYYAKYININSPFLPYHFYQKLVLFVKLKKNTHFHKNPLDLRNSQEVRNHMAEVMCILTHATKTRKSISIPKIGQKDFENSFFHNNLIAEENTVVSNILNPKDPKELQSICQTFYYYLQDNNYNLTKAIYWLFWIIEWEKLMILKYGHYTCYTRHNLLNLEEKHGTDVIWIFWCLILIITERRYDTKLSQQVKSYLEFYKFKYTTSKKKKRIYFMINCIQLLDPNLNISLEKYPILENYPVTLQACANINIVYEHFKKEETVGKNYQNSKTKLDATFVITKHQDISQLSDLSKYRQQLKEKNQREKEYRQFKAKKKLENRKSREEREAMKKYMLEKIDNHIINTSNQRPAPTSNLSSSSNSHQKKLESNNQKTIHIMNKIDDKIKINESKKKRNKSKPSKTDYLFQVIKTDKSIK